MSNQDRESNTIEILENYFWDESSLDSYLVTTCHKLRKKPISEFEIEDLRIMISQNIGLKFLFPLAVEKLKEDIFAAGDFYDGELLQAILNVENNFWINNLELKVEIENLILGKEDEMKNNNIKSNNFFK